MKYERNRKLRNTYHLFSKIYTSSMQKKTAIIQDSTAAEAATLCYMSRS